MTGLNSKGWFVVFVSSCFLTAVFATTLLTEDLAVQSLLLVSVVLGTVVAGGIMKENRALFVRESLYEEPAIIDVTGKDSVKCPKCGLPMRIPVRTISMKRLESIQEEKEFAQNELVKLGLCPCVVNPRHCTKCPVCSRSIICIDQFSLHIRSRSTVYSPNHIAN